MNTVDKQNISDDIMGCQGIVDDLRAIEWRIDDTSDPVDICDLQDALQGLSVLYEIKFRKLWASLSAA